MNGSAKKNDQIDLGIYSESPFLGRVQKFLIRTLTFYLKFILIRDFIFALILAFIFTFQLRKYSSHVLIDILFIVIVFLLYFVIGLFVAGLLPKINQFIFGRPVFGKIGGLNRRFFFTTLRCADAIRFEFKPEDMDRVREFGRLDRILTEELLKMNYKRIAPSSPDELASTFENDWKNIWNQKILKVKTFNKNGDEILFDNMMAEDNLSMKVEVTKLNLVSLLIASIVVLFQVIMAFIIWKFVNGQLALVTVFQIGLVISLIVSSVVFAYHSHQNAEIPIAEMENIPKDIINPLKETLEKIGNEPFRPSKVIIRNDYLPIIRNFFAPYLFWYGLLNSMIMVILLCVPFLIGLIWQQGNISASLSWYINFGIGLLLIPFGFLVGFYLMFLAVQNFRLLIAPIVVGVLSVVLPFILSYIFSGEFDVNKFNSAFIAAGTAIITGVATVITTKIKSNIEAKN